MATLTENGALSYPVDDPLLELFYRALRNTPEEKMRALVLAAWKGPSGEGSAVQQSRHLHVLKVLFHLRWCRGGKGERNMFRIGMDELVKNDEKQHVLANLGHFPFFGYWKDLLFFFDTEIESQALELYCTQLRTDIGNLCNRQEQLVTLAAKWAPSERKEIDRKHMAVAKFCERLGVNKASYRKQYLVPLRKHLCLVETQMCNGEWNSVNYARLPALARLKYAKAFRNHDNARYSQYLSNVADGKEKMNIKLIYPYQLVAKYLSGGWGGFTPNDYSDEFPDDVTLDTMWNELVKQTRADLITAGANLQALGVADCSGSMSGVPMQNSVALSLLWSELCNGRFHGHFYTFSSQPKLVRITAKTLRDKVKQVMEHAVIENTNVQAVFDDLLSHAQMWSLPIKSYPKKIYMFTDGQFDQMTTHGSKTNLEVIEEKHLKAHYPIPEMVFWNLRGDTVDFPAPRDKKGVAMLSGFSPSLMKLVMEGKELTPTGVLMQAIKDPAFDRVKLG